ncbi:hypothetical protein ACFC26_15905 [Kitasatospora purpeofusca]|uniref:hypothetical protein n=1 Tax=Kitasatospora purpeofusca TaxID=67352 RepID=UPI0035E32428
MLHLHHNRTTAPPVVLVDRVDSLPGGRAVALLAGDGQLILLFARDDLAQNADEQLQSLLQRAIEDNIITVNRDSAVTESRRHAS